MKWVMRVEEIASAVPVRTWEGFTKEVTFELVLKELVRNSPKNQERVNEHSRQRKRQVKSKEKKYIWFIGNK